jgi:UDP-GlcNAc3NAcA epimerase
MKIMTVVGARPQFIKAAPLSSVLREKHHEVLVHTGQHYDDVLSGLFFRELNLPSPDYELGVGSGSHAWQTAEMLKAIERLLEIEQPDYLLVFGDTNSTLAGALAAAKLHVRVAHVEAGVRSYNRAMPEEINRILTDHVAHLLFCPTPRSVENLRQEGIAQGVYHVGDVMYDALLTFLPVAMKHSSILEKLRLTPRAYALLTIHRAENVDCDERLRRLVAAMSSLDVPVLFPAHPRTRKRMEALGRIDELGPQVCLLAPLGYLDMLLLQSQALAVFTDSGGVQREAYFLSVPSVILRTETEWPELIQAGCSYLAGAELERMRTAGLPSAGWTPSAEIFGAGDACRKICRQLSTSVSN